MKGVRASKMSLPRRVHVIKLWYRRDFRSIFSCQSFSQLFLAGIAEGSPKHLAIVFFQLMKDGGRSRLVLQNEEN